MLSTFQISLIVLILQLRTFDTFTPPPRVSKNIVFLFTNGCLESQRKDHRSVSICFTLLFGIITTSAKNPICESNKIKRLKL